MGRSVYTEEYRRKHVLELKKAKNEITDDELSELEFLTNKYFKILHRFRANSLIE